MVCFFVLFFVLKTSIHYHKQHVLGQLTFFSFDINYICKVKFLCKQRSVDYTGKRNGKSIMGLNIQKSQKWLEYSLLKLNSLFVLQRDKAGLKMTRPGGSFSFQPKTFSKMRKDQDTKQNFDPRFNRQLIYYSSTKNKNKHGQKAIKSQITVM